MTSSEKAEKHAKELDYNEAYSFLFNSVSDIIKVQVEMVKQMLILQKQCEEICIGNQPENLILASEQIREMLVDMIKKNMAE